LFKISLILHSLNFLTDCFRISQKNLYALTLDASLTLPSSEINHGIRNILVYAHQLEVVPILNFSCTPLIYLLVYCLSSIC